MSVVAGRHDPARLRLGVNIDHVATVRNARGGEHPDPVRAALLAIEAGADGITAHLREDRRHIRDADMDAIKASITKPLNFEMAATDEMVSIALRVRPNACCLVPERREERTTEGGLDVAGAGPALAARITKLKAAGIRVSLFVEPDSAALDASAACGADIVELHTGRYCELALEGHHESVARELARIAEAARFAASIGLEVHAGHGLTFATAPAIAALPPIVELNIGHFLVGEAIFTGLREAVGKMRAVMDSARTAATVSTMA